MTDHRVDDLSYGHLGEATYDIHTNQWGFSRDLSEDHYLQQLTPFKQCVPPSIRNISEGKKRSSHIARSHIKWLTKANPETFPANSIASGLARAPSTLQSDLPPTFGALLALGRAVDVDHMSDGSRVVPIAAMSCGEAGHVLRLIKPKSEKYGWEKGGGVKLSSLDLGSSDQGHWAGTGGTIQQIAFANDEDGVGTWFAVRQNAITTIFRPIYRKLPTPFVAPSGYAKLYPPSRLSPNPVTFLTAERSGSRSHVDVTFNPWYTRQFAVVDELGRWSLWDIEGRKHKRTTLEVIAGKSGEIHDGSIHDQTSKMIDNADGWHRILWAGSVSTVVVCNRRKLAVFDIKANPTLLEGPDLMAASSLDWILDIKRSPAKLSHLFVLTSSRVFWVEILPAGEDKNSRNSGTKILLSYRHFRDSNDETMKLAVHGDEDGSIVLISSSKSPLVHFYHFSKALKGSPRPVGSHSTMMMSTCLDNKTVTETQSSLQTLCLMPAVLIPSLSTRQGLGSQYMERDVRFYQIWVLRSDLEVVSILCAMTTVMAQEESTLKRNPIVAPTIRSVQPLTSIASRHIKDSFVAPDGFDDEDVDDGSLLRDLNASSRSNLPIGRGSTQSDLPLRVSFLTTFQKAFIEDSHIVSSNDQQEDSSDFSKTMAELLDIIAKCVQEGKQNDRLKMSTLLEFANLRSFSGDFDQAASALQHFSTSLALDDDAEALSTLVLTDLTSSPGIGLSTSNSSENTPLDLLRVYDHLVDIWVTSLPLKTSGQTRLAKFKVIRKIAVELCLGSMAISLRSKLAQVQEITEELSKGKLTLSLREKQRCVSRSSSPAFMSSQTNQDSLREPNFSLPTPSRTPSLYSQTTGSTSEPSEDLAIVRLRQYSLEAKCVVEPSSGCSWLSHWPPTPDTDPSIYSWDAVQKSKEAQLGSGDEDDDARRREEARRRRRTEKFLNRERAKSSQAISQTAYAAFGSQPEVVHHAFSSQVVEDVPMTQPDRGTFGSRSAQQTNKKQKKRRAAGF